MGIDFAYWGLQTLAMIVTALLLPGFRVRGPIPALLAVLLIGFINSSVWNAALFFHVPDNFSLEVLTLLAANAVIFVVVIKLVPGIFFDRFLPMLIAPFLFTLTSILISTHLSDVDWGKLSDAALGQMQGLRSGFESSILGQEARGE